MEEHWKTSVTEIIRIFHGALTSLIPWLEKARIKWKEGDSYDDWDNIVTTLYENIVCSSLKAGKSYSNSMAKYDYEYDSYRYLDYIKIKSQEYESDVVFISFISRTPAMNAVKAAVIDNSEKVLEYIYLLHDDIEYCFVQKEVDRKVLIDEIDVLL